MNRKKTITIICTGGGSGGHVFPGIAIAHQIHAQNADATIIWLGQKNGIEAHIVMHEPSLTFIGISAGKFRRYCSLHNIIDIFKIVLGFMQSLYILWQLKPQCLFSKGGFVAVPPVLAAKILRIPVIIHESDYTPGLATRITSHCARAICVAYEESRAYYAPTAPVIYTGNPIRTAIKNASFETGRQLCVQYALHTDKPLLLIQGGSLGAHEINTLVKQNYDFLTTHFCVIHQTGNNAQQHAHTSSYYSQAFFDDTTYPHLLCISYAVISRSGAGSLWEIAYHKKPAILIPLTEGTRGDQIHNAQYFSTHGACIVYDKHTAQLPDLCTQYLLHQTMYETMQFTYTNMPLINTDAEIHIANLIMRELYGNNKP